MRGDPHAGFCESRGVRFPPATHLGSGYVTPAKKPQYRELYTREHEYNNQVSSIRAPIERAVAHLKTWKILFTDYRRPLNTFLDSFRAAIGLYFFELSFQ